MVPRAFVNKEKPQKGVGRLLASRDVPPITAALDSTPITVVGPGSETKECLLNGVEREDSIWQPSRHPATPKKKGEARMARPAGLREKCARAGYKIEREKKGARRLGFLPWRLV